MAKSQNKDSAAAGLSNYELRWNDHIPYFTNIFQSLRDLNELTDVTFACEDGIVCAHKIVLSSCSVYLRILFTRLGTPHPVIFLKNTPVMLVRHILEFIYCGSVKVSKEELALVLSLGHSLQIQGLSKLKLSKDDDFGVDKRVDKLAKEREKIQENIASKAPLLPGEVRKSSIVSLNKDKGTDLDLENNNNNNNNNKNDNNNDLSNPKITRQSKTTPKVAQSQEKKTKDQPKASSNVQNKEKKTKEASKVSSKVIQNKEKKSKEPSNVSSKVIQNKERKSKEPTKVSSKVIQNKEKKPKVPLKAFSKVVQSREKETKEQSKAPTKVMQNKEKTSKEQPKASLRVIQNREKANKGKNYKNNSNPEKPQQQKSLQEKVQKSQTQKKKHNCKSKTNKNKINTRAKSSIGPKLREKNETVAKIMTNKKALADKLRKKNETVAKIKTNKKALADKLPNLIELKPIKIGTPNKSYYRYDPKLKKLIGKYYVDHGVSKAQKYFEQNFGFEIPYATLWKMKEEFLANHQK